MSADAAIEIQGAARVHGQGERAVRALDVVLPTIRNVEFFTLLGPSSCGKTTLLRLIAGFETPTAGRIAIAAQAEPNVCIRGNHTSPELIEKFERKYDVDVTITDCDSDTTAMTKLEAGGRGFDFAVPTHSYI